MNSSGVTGAAASILHKTVATSLVSIALLLNIVCIILTAKITCGKPQWPNVLVLHMGIIDVCMVVLVMIPSAITLYIPTVLNQLYFCQYQGTVLNMWYIIELVLLCQIMFDRYFAITHPFVYSKHILKSKALVWSNAVFAGTTTAAILIACLPLTTRVEFVIVGPGLCFWDISQDKALPTSIVYVVITWTILAVLVFLTGGISIGVHRMLRRAHSSDTDHVRKNMNKMEINFAKLAIVTSLVYGASSIPFTVVLVIDMTGQFVDLDVQYIALCILMANVLLNPLLHSAIRRPVRKALLVLARWLLYITFGCRSSLHPKTQIDEALGLTNKLPLKTASSRPVTDTDIQMSNTRSHNR